MTASQRSHYTKRRKEIWQALHPATTVQRFESVFDAIGEQVGEVCPPVAKHGHQQDPSFAASTAAVTGESKRAINMHIARADEMGGKTLPTQVPRRMRAREVAAL